MKEVKVLDVNGELWVFSAILKEDGWHPMIGCVTLPETCSSEEEAVAAAEAEAMAQGLELEDS